MKNIKLWENKIPFYNEDFQTKDNENTATINAYTVDDGKKHSAVVICPGGGYTHRANHEGEGIALWLNSLGISAFVVNYRVNPYIHPVELTDAKRAMKYVRYNSDKFNIYADKIGIMGFSAGAHLAGCVAEYYDKIDNIDNIDSNYNNDPIDNTSAKPDMLCLCYPVVTLCESYGHMGSRENLLGEYADLSVRLSLEKNVREDMSPTFIWHTFEDKSVPVINSLELAKSLKENNIPFELHIFPEGRHGLGLAEDIEGTSQWSQLFVDWLKRTEFIK